MKIKNGYTLKKHQDYYSVYTPNKDEIETLQLNDLGAFLWDCLKEQNLSNSELLNLILNKFEISTVLALGEIDTFIKNCKENGIFE